MSGIKLEDLGNRSGRELTEAELQSIRCGVLISSLEFRPPIPGMPAIELPASPPTSVEWTREYPYYRFIQPL